MEEKEANALPPIQPSDRRRRKKFVPKEPLVLGPFYGDVTNELALASPVQFLNAEWKQKNPFEGCEVVVAGLVSSSKSSNPSVANEFSPDLVSVLIEVNNAERDKVALHLLGGTTESISRFE